MSLRAYSQSGSAAFELNGTFSTKTDANGSRTVLTPLEQTSSPPVNYLCIYLYLSVRMLTHCFVDSQIHLPSDLGMLYKVRLGLQSLENNMSQLSLRHFKIQNTSTLDTFSLTINKTLPLSPNGDRWIEFPIQWPLKEALSGRYKSTSKQQSGSGG